MKHELTTWPVYFDAVLSGVKRFEIRLDDRGFVVGDVLWLREWDIASDQYSGRSVEATVTYVLGAAEAERMGVVRGFVVMSIELVAAPLLDSDLYDLGLPLRPYNALRNEGVRTVGELVSLSEGQALAARGFGRHSLQAVRATLEAHGLGFEAHHAGPLRDAPYLPIRDFLAFARRRRASQVKP